MPRKARIDAPGALHHIVIRGIERRHIFTHDQDRDNFIGRLGDIVTETKTFCFAWALMPNYAHILLRTGQTEPATVMRRLLTGYAVSNNRRHRRYGHLFQNRYKSILCQQDSYLLELVRYIHLNPLRAKMVMRLSELGIALEQLWATGKHPATVKARSLLCYWAVSKLGFSTTELSKELGISQPAVSISVKRGKKLPRPNS